MNIETKIPADLLYQNSQTMKEELEWFNQMLESRFRSYFQQEPPDFTIDRIQAPDLSGNPSVYAKIVAHYDMSVAERLLLMLALAPHICPQLLDIFFTQNQKYGRGFTEFGGLKGIQHGGFLPTGETALFLLAGSDLSLRFRFLKLFDPEHFFSKHRILWMDGERNSESYLSSPIVLNLEYLFLFTTGQQYTPPFSSEFPAMKIHTNLEWEDLVLDEVILEELQEILNWIRYNHILLETWNLKKVIKAGFKSLFYGPPGTGKTLTAALLGKTTGLDVFRVDLSKVVSKYIGETEKNLANIFDIAENKNWILFFDEADALFGKRTSTTDAKDRYANQEVAYLLQRIEDYTGVVILASNLKTNIDEAFARRFQSIIYFPIPRPEQRLRLWANAFSNIPLNRNVNLDKIAEKYELTGGAIINVLRQCALIAIERDPPVVNEKDIVFGIRKELKKEGKTI